VLFALEHNEVPVGHVARDLAVLEPLPFLYRVGGFVPPQVEMSTGLEEAAAYLSLASAMDELVEARHLTVRALVVSAIARALLVVVATVAL